ncbi:hypothetical protein LC085_20880 [Bacillus tianshenii]|nr:hypothetical protein [Bacillus tianshenii]MCA1322337.1 hypothetical protein [Bacillus tianshenii]
MKKIVLIGSGGSGKSTLARSGLTFHLGKDWWKRNSRMFYKNAESLQR